LGVRHSLIVATRWPRNDGGLFMNDQVPEKWRSLFTNEEWLQHQFIVYGSWIQLALAVLVHGLIWTVKPWFK
jgi:light-harvesting complex 1 beta chain